jgi:hypothetical protein
MALYFSDEIELFKNNGNVILFENLPVDADQGPSPTNSAVPYTKKTFVSETLLVSFLNLLDAKPLTYEQGQGGVLITQLCPQDKHKGKAFDSGDGELRSHCDKSMMPFILQPDYLFIIGLRNPNNIPTYVIPNSKTLEQLSPEDKAELRLAQFAFSPPDYYGKVEPNTSTLMPILWGDEKMVYAEHLCISCDSTGGARALDALKTVLQETDLSKYSVNWGEGSGLLFKNHSVLHSRPVIPLVKEEGVQERWGQRVYGFDNLSIEVLINGGLLAEDSNVITSSNTGVQGGNELVYEDSIRARDLISITQLNTVPFGRNMVGTAP